MPSQRLSWIRPWLYIALAVAFASPAAAQTAPLPDVVPCAPIGQQLVVKIPEINRDPATKALNAVLITADEPRNVWFKNSDGTAFCAPQYLRYFKGYRFGHADDWNVKDFRFADFPEPIPGPTLRARVGDLIKITFLNQIQTKHFGASIDQGEKGLGCDSPTGANYPGTDTMPNCIHGSSTSNLHFHGTHTTPSTTGDNVLLQIRPSLRKYPPEPDGVLLATEQTVQKPFAEFFKWCDSNGSPTRWGQMPESFRRLQMGKSTTSPGGWLGDYDKLKEYERGKLWPINQRMIDDGAWPTYFIGAFPYCFRLPEFDPAKVKMGQAPGTHWYHAHKHGSTEINVANGMTGAFIIEGDYDDTLRAFYRSTTEHRNWDLEEKVLVIQQLGTVPNLVSTQPLGANVLSVNGRQQPIITMRPGQVQLWRIVNGASRSMVALCPPAAGFSWRQTAQDGVQFRPENYKEIGAVNARVVLASANRADLLLQAGTTLGDFDLRIVEGVAPPGGGTCDGKSTLVKVRVQNDPKVPAPQPAMPFIDEGSFPQFPDFLKDIPLSEVRSRRDLVFASKPNGDPPAPRKAPPGNSHYIDGQQFGDHRVDQSMLLDTVEEWRVMNATTFAQISHPFHIHVNPFQVTTVFDPNETFLAGGASLPRYVFDETPLVDGQCRVIPEDQSTWKVCKPRTANFVWWDVFAIPAGVDKPLDKKVCTEKENCPEPIRRFTECTGGTCTVTIPGYFTMRSRFADYPGQFVLHCHILIHEDRGMMQLVQIVPNTTPYGHK